MTMTDLQQQAFANPFASADQTLPPELTRSFGRLTVGLTVNY